MEDKNKVINKKRVAVVTGANGGFGKEFVKLLLNEELNEVWAIARNGERLDLLAEECGEKVKTIVMDLTDRKCFDLLRDRFYDEKVEIAYLINNAGFAKFGAYDDISMDVSLNMIDLNVSAVVAMGLLCIPFMAAGGRILNVASQASFFPLPYMNIYAATKTFVKNYTRALNVELKDRGISATAVCPGWMKTDLLKTGEVGAKNGVTVFAHVKPPAAVAKKALSDAKKGRDISVCGAYVKASHVLSKFFTQKAMMRVWLRQQKIK